MVTKNRKNFYTYKDQPEMLRRVKNEKAAIIVDKMESKTLLSRHCGLYPSTDALLFDMFAFPVSKKFKYKEFFDKR